MGNGDAGIWLLGAKDSMVGGAQPSLGNLIAGNEGGDGILVGLAVPPPKFAEPEYEAIGNVIQNNVVGLASDRKTILENDRYGINYPTAAAHDNNAMDNLFGAGQKQNINDVINDPKKGNKEKRNSLIMQKGSGSGSGSQVGVPNLSSAVASGNALTVQGTLSGKPNLSYVIEFHGVYDDGVIGHIRTEIPIGAVTVTTDSNGDASFSATLSTIFGNYVSADATSAPSDGYTSIFSDDFAITGESSTAAVGGSAWDDLCYTGIAQAGDLVMPAVSVSLYDTSNTLIATTTTASDGSYLFTGVSAGDYYLKFTLPSGFSFTQPFQGNGMNDSEADPVTGQTPVFTLIAGEVYRFESAGMVTGAGSAPAVTSLSASSGSTAGGTIVTISGSGLSGATAVLFGDVEADYYVNSDGQITAVAPAQAAGTVDVRVVGPWGVSAVSTSDHFTYSAGSSPTVSSLSLTSGSANGGDIVTITGSGFSDTVGVQFGGVAADWFEVLNDSTIVAGTPAQAAGTVDVTVTNNAGTSATSSSDHFTLAAASAPAITAITPNSGPATGGSVVVLLGSGFMGASAVTFGSDAAIDFEVMSDNAIMAIAPAGTGTVHVQVTTPSGTSTTGSADQFSFSSVSAPAISSLSASSGTSDGGTLLTITGSGFTTVRQVLFGDAEASNFVVNSDTQITLLTPAHTPGTFDVQLVGDAGTSAAVSADRFTFTTASTPSISALDTTSGGTGGGTAVKISGSNLSAATAVLFGDVYAESMVVNSDGTITAVSPPQAAGTVEVRVVSPTGMSAPASADHFTYNSAGAPSVSSLGTTGGSTGGGTKVTIQGSGFLGATAVKFGSVAAADYTVVSDTAIIATAPAQAATTVHVTVKTYSGTSSTSSADQFVYSAASAPSVSALTAASGPTTGGTAVVITGSNFNGATQVSFGSRSAAFVVNSDTSITAYAPLLPAGSYVVRVTTPSGQSSASGPSYTYNNVTASAPAVTNVSPSTGSTAGGRTVLITGTNFAGATAVKFGNNNASAYTILSDTQISATAPSGSAGTVDIKVTTNNGTSSAVSADHFTYVSAGVPTVASMGAGSGGSGGGTSVNLTGTNFTSVQSVMFGNVPAASYTVNSSTSITAVSPAQAAGTVNVTVTTQSGTSAAGAGNAFTYTSGSAPTITSLGTSSGSTAGGTSVTINGTNFTGVTAVTFGGLPAAFTVVSATQITATAPAQYAGTFDVRVSTYNGTSAPGSSARFTYSSAGAPSVTGLSASTGSTAGGTTVNIGGSGFSGAVAVMFGSVPAASFTVNSDTSITATSPSQAAGTVDVTVTNHSGVSASTSSDHFAYTAASAPTVSSLGTTSGSTGGGTPVLINGTNLTSATAVMFGNVPAASFQVISATQISAVSPPQAAGTVDVTVTTYGGTSSTSSNDHFTYSAASVPGISSLGPNSGTGAGGDLITILGSNFLGASEVTFGGLSAAFTVVNDSVILATAPAQAAGNVYVQVTTPSGTSSTGSSSQFTYSAASAPTISSLNVSSGSTAGGTVVTITGTNLSNVDAVRFGDVDAASFLVVNSTTIQATAPVHGAGVVDVQVSAAGTQSALSSSDRFTFTAAAFPTVSSLSTTTGSTQGGTAVTITGTNLSGAVAVLFGGTPAEFTVVSSTSIQAIAPSQAASGSVDVQVMTESGTSAAVSGDRFTYTAAAAPSVTGVTAASGSSAGGTVVTIVGNHFMSATAVYFGTVAAEFSVETDGWIVATAPPHTAGTVDVTVTSGGGTSSTSSADHFAYSAASNPSVTGVTPASGSVAGGGVVLITGSGFRAATAVNFGSTPAADFSVLSDTAIRATAPAASAGTVDITVTTPSGTSTTSSADHYAFNADSTPTVSGLGTNSGGTGGGTAVIITGTNFTDLTDVLFGTVPATAFFVDSATQITAISPAQPAGTVHITVVNPAGTSSTGSSDQFTVNSGSAPTVSGVSPAWDDLKGGKTVTVTGTNFSGVKAVSFGGLPATGFTVLSSGVLVVTVPPAASAGNVHITVTNQDGTSSTSSSDLFHFDTAPVGQNDSYTATENQALNVSSPGVLSNDSDADGDSLTAVSVVGPNHGTLTLNSDGSFSYTPTTGYTGTDTFSYYTNDGYENSNLVTVTITVGQPMLVDSAHEGVDEVGDVITDENLKAIVHEAVQRWIAAMGETGMDLSGMEEISVKVVNLGGGYLGLTTVDGILIDKNAEGYGWFIDPTPGADEEFADGGGGRPAPSAAGKMDLLTVVMHEIGHVLGYADDHGHDIMQERLAAGTRILPTLPAGGPTLTQAEVGGHWALLVQAGWVTHPSQLAVGQTPGTVMGLPPPVLVLDGPSALAQYGQAFAEAMADLDTPALFPPDPPMPIDTADGAFSAAELTEWDLFWQQYYGI